MIEDKKVNSMESKKNKFDLFDYLKNHDAIVIALVTALVTITTTILNMAVYLYDKAYLHYFHVDAYCANPRQNVQDGLCRPTHP